MINSSSSYPSFFMLNKTIDLLPFYSEIFFQYVHRHNAPHDFAIWAQQPKNQEFYTHIIDSLLYLVLIDTSSDALACLKAMGIKGDSLFKNYQSIIARSCFFSDSPGNFSRIKLKLNTDPTQAQSRSENRSPSSLLHDSTHGANHSTNQYVQPNSLHEHPNLPPLLETNSFIIYDTAFSCTQKHYLISADQWQLTMSSHKIMIICTCLISNNYQPLEALKHISGVRVLIGQCYGLIFGRIDHILNQLHRLDLVDTADTFSPEVLACQDQSGQSILHRLFETGQIECIKYTASQHPHCFRLPFNLPLGHYLIELNQLVGIGTLALCGYDFTQIDRFHYSMLSVAIRHGRLDICKILWQEVPILSTKLCHLGHTPLSLSILFGQLDITQYLLGLNEVRRTLDWFVTKAERTALMMAIGSGFTEGAKALIDVKASLNPKNRYGENALSLAVLEGSFEILCLLLQLPDQATPSPSQFSISERSVGLLQETLINLPLYRPFQDPRNSVFLLYYFKLIDRPSSSSTASILEAYQHIIDLQNVLGNESDWPYYPKCSVQFNLLHANHNMDPSGFCYEGQIKHQSLKLYQQHQGQLRSISTGADDNRYDIEEFYGCNHSLRLAVADFWWAFFLTQSQTVALAPSKRTNKITDVLEPDKFLAFQTLWKQLSQKVDFPDTKTIFQQHKNQSHFGNYNCYLNYLHRYFPHQLHPLASPNSSHLNFNAWLSDISFFSGYNRPKFKFMAISGVISALSNLKEAFLYFNRFLAFVLLYRGDFTNRWSQSSWVYYNGIITLWLKCQLYGGSRSIPYEKFSQMLAVWALIYGKPAHLSIPYESMTQRLSSRLIENRKRLHQRPIQSPVEFFFWGSHQSQLLVHRLAKRLW